MHFTRIRLSHKDRLYMMLILVIIFFPSLFHSSKTLLYIYFIAFVYDPIIKAQIVAQLQHLLHIVFIKAFRNCKTLNCGDLIRKCFAIQVKISNYQLIEVLPYEWYALLD